MLSLRDSLRWTAEADVSEQRRGGISKLMPVRCVQDDSLNETSNITASRGSNSYSSFVFVWKRLKRGIAACLAGGDFIQRKSPLSANLSTSLLA